MRIVPAMALLLALCGCAAARSATTVDPYACGQWWQSGSALTVEARRVKPGETEISIRDGAGQVRYKASEAATLVGILQPNAVNGNLALIWQGASAFSLQMLSSNSGRIVVTLSEPSDSMPEFIYPPDKTKEPLLIVTDWQWSDEGGQSALKPRNARLFTWTGTEYASGGSVPWEKRHSLGAPR